MDFITFGKQKPWHLWDSCSTSLPTEKVLSVVCKGRELQISRTVEAQDKIRSDKISIVLCGCILFCEYIKYSQAPAHCCHCFSCICCSNFWKREDKFYFGVWWDTYSHSQPLFKANLGLKLCIVIYSWYALKNIVPNRRSDFCTSFHF